MTTSTRSLLPLTCLLLVSACSSMEDETWPLTRAEASGFEGTSSSADVIAFIDEVVSRSSVLARDSAGSSGKDLDLGLVLAADPSVSDVDDAASDPRPKILVIGNIHAGEVEGKEAIQILVREIAQGRHRELIRDQIVIFLPNYNPDGNDALGPRNRRGQNGPHCEVGTRVNSDRLDLNRDFMKARAPETQALLRLMRVLDPILFVDCHTTDGSYHGFELTYAPPLCPATDGDLLSYQRRTFLPRLRRDMEKAGFRIYDYGNWSRRSRRKEWRTFDSRPRFSTNYFGLRNRLALLSEAYSYESFERRIAVTRQLVLCALRGVATDRDLIVSMLETADRRAAALGGTATLPTGSRMAFTEIALVPESSVRRVRPARGGGTVIQDQNVHTWLSMRAFVHFAGIDDVPVPHGWIVARPDAVLLQTLRLHGIRHEFLESRETLNVGIFRVSRRVQDRRAFQGFRATTLEGRYLPVTETFPAGSLFVPARQPLARLVFKLLEPRSDDGLSAWDMIRPVMEADGSWSFPVRALYEPRERAIE